ncbi:hypothetical protein [Streptococcus parauberis]|uniref:Uncharacterized protein n=1 Tax=Streptococcus parauberis KRS-02083 TaxID=1207545 RepID=A0ABN0IQ10_9STRE|nr:hypothetical protein [Streptococcus parauberis]AUT05199.1 hypothetical protein SPSF3K_00458 [Streptococcus parauberis]EMG24928.1 hypothetical protein SPJ1_1799 [Streptococcus parauberis KRS-02083]KYP17085.1 hypothetical protein TN39_01998 [Streptococcus parauberis]KYP17279.1 hypothetical protein AKL14_01703 [Streptococcus parauberis]KYP17318.1 hypothetical protein AKL13_01988 [Streptococcus parauberis]
MDNNHLLKLPKGDIFYQAENGKYSDGVKLISKPTISTAKLLKGFSDKLEQLTLTVDVEKASNYQLIYYLKTVEKIDPEYQLSALKNVNDKVRTAKVTPSEYL